MAELQLTIASSNSNVSVNEDSIIFVESDTLGAKVTYERKKDGSTVNSVVTEAPSTIQGNSDYLMSITDEDSNTVYVNINRIGELVVNSTGVLFQYEFNNTIRQIQTTDTETTFYNNLYTQQGDLTYEIDSFNATNKTVTLKAAEGDVTAKFTSGVAFTIVATGTGNDTMYTTSSSTTSGGKTVITVNETIADGSPTSGLVLLNE